MEINIYNLIIIISGTLGVIFWLKEDQKKAVVAIIVLLAAILLKQMGI